MHTKQEIILKWHREKKSQNSIVAELGIHKKTVRRYIEEFKARLAESPDEPELALSKVLSDPPRYDTSNRSKRKLTLQVTKIIDSLLEENEQKRRKGLFKQLLKNRDIHRHLVEQGISIGYTTVSTYISSQKGKNTHREAFIRQHYEPGVVCEFDWAEIRLEINGKEGRYYMAAFTSAFSNYRYARIYTRQDTLAFLESHAAFFAHTGALYSQMVYDNMRVAVARFTGPEKQPTEALLQLRAHYQFTHRFTNFYRGNEKGHVERSVEYVRRRSFGIKSSFGSLQEAQNWLDQKLGEINQTRQQLTGKTALALFEEEKKVMPAAPIPMECAQWVQLRVDKYATVSYRTNRYSVPDHLVGAFVTVKVRTDQLQIFDDQQCLAIHTRSYDTHEWIININHYLETFKRKPGALAGSVALASSGYLKELFVAYFQDAPREFIGLLSYCLEHQITDQRLSQVVQRLHSSGVRQITAAKIEVLLGNKTAETPSVPATQTTQMALSQLNQISSLLNSSYHE